MGEACGICDAEFGSPADLIDHMKQAHGVTPSNLPTAPVAVAPASSPATRRRQPFECAICGLTFETRERLAQHNLNADHGSIMTGHSVPLGPRGTAGG